MTPTLTTAEPRAAAVIHLEIPREEMRTAMPAAIQELIATLGAQGVRPAGPLFAHHVTTSSTMFDFEVGFPVDSGVQAAGRVRSGQLPGGRVARAVYEGPYEGLFEAWRDFGEWMKREGHTGRGDIWEIYAAGPESSPDPAGWRTELYIPLR